MMDPPSKPGWERVGDAMVGWCGYLLLIPATILSLLAGPKDPGWQLTTLAIVGTAAAWTYLMFTKLPAPRQAHRLRVGLFFLGLLVLAAILMLRMPLFFIYMISGFFYASILRPLPLAFVGVFATSFLINTLISGFPQTSEVWTFYVVLIVIQTVVIGSGSIIGEKMSEQNEERRRALARLQAAQAENAGLQAQLVTQAREAGILDERARMAREIHDTIAQGLTGVITQLEAARHVRDRPYEHDRHLANAERLARESLSEARRSVEGALPAALESASLPDALREVAREWSERTGVPSELTVTGDPITLESVIEVTLLRTAQEALANVEKHAHARRARLTLSFMGDVVTLDVRDDGVGFDAERPEPAPGGGFGLHGMRQRVARVAGTLVIESEPGGGTAISARVPAIPTSAGAVSTP
jgi:signal transduction histidine kinase